MAKSPTLVIRDSWQGYAERRDGVPLFVSYDATAHQVADEPGVQKQYPLTARIAIPIIDPLESGGPGNEEAPRLWDLEEAIGRQLGTLGVECWMVARLTQAGIRELVFQVASESDFRPPVEAWIAATSDYPMRLSIEPGWGYFLNCIRPDARLERYIADQSVVENLIEAGSNPERAHDLEFVFVGANKGLKRLARELAARGYQGVEARYPIFRAGTLVMSKPMPLDVDLIAEHSHAHADLAKLHGVEYDGWGTCVLRDE